MVSHPETGSDSPIGSDRDRGCDSRILMQQLIPLAIRGVLDENACTVIVKLCNFFKQLCSKVLNANQLEHLENDIIVMLCKLERIFHVSFFDVMMHLPIHPIFEAKVAGPVQYRWVYPIERYVSIHLILCILGFIQRIN